MNNLNTQTLTTTNTNIVYRFNVEKLIQLKIAEEK